VSERAIRALIGARKNWGGNRTPRGARAQAVLTSILQTAKQQGKKPFDVLLELLGSSDQLKTLDLVPAPETPLEPVNSSLHPPLRFTVPDILAPPPSPGLAAAPV
jgi:transposase